MGRMLSWVDFCGRFFGVSQCAGQQQNNHVAVLKNNEIFGYSSGPS